jgi:branched-chain amino acid transport system ATP-binding protein
LFLEVRDLTVYYGIVLALDNISLSVDEAEIVALLGANGAGKSTALKAICGLQKPRSGEITFGGERINEKQPYQLARKGLCLVPEGRRIFGSMSVLENLEMGAYTNSNRKSVREDIDRVLDFFPALKERKKQRAGTLSTGEQQMLAIGRALVLKPRFLLLDEPSLGLSPNYVEAVFEKTREICREGTAIVLAEQNAEMVLGYADRCFVFEMGRISWQGKASDLALNDEIRRVYLGT